MSSFTRVETIYEDGSRTVDIHEWFRKSATEVRKIYKNLHPEDRFWEDDTHVRWNTIHGFFDPCPTVQKRVTFHDERPDF